MASEVYTLAFPVFAPEDYAWIEEIRRRNARPPGSLVDPHFTLVFGMLDVDQQIYLAHVARIARATAPITFHCRSAIVGADHRGPEGHVFLVPDEGRAEISALHDRLYTGPLAAALRSDLGYVPHITVATMDTADEAQTVCGQLGAGGISIAGRIDRLSVLAVAGHKVTTLAELPVLES